MALLFLQESRAESALEFDGTDDRVLVPYSDSFPIETFTLAAWIKMTPPGNRSAVIAHGEDDNSFNLSWQLYINPDGTLQIMLENQNEQNFTYPLTFFGGEPQASCGNAQGLFVADDQWHHVAATRELSGLLDIYIDGEPRAHCEQTGVPSSNNFQDLSIGCTFGTIGPPPGGVEPPIWFFPGAIDDPAVWNAALSPSDIQQVYNNCVDPSDQRLIGFWPFDEGAGQFVADLSAAGNDGYLGADPSSDAADPQWISASRICGPVSCLGASGDDCNANGVHDACDLLASMVGTGFAFDQPAYGLDAFVRVFDNIPSSVAVGPVGSTMGATKDVAVDPTTGLVYTIDLFPDQLGQQVWIVNPQTGTGTALPNPTLLPETALIWGLAFDEAGNLYGGGLGVYLIDKTTGIATELAGLDVVPVQIFGMAKTPWGVGFLSTGLILVPEFPFPYFAVHDADGLLIDGAIFLTADGTGEGRVLFDLAMSPEGLILGNALPASLFAAPAVTSESQPTDDMLPVALTQARSLSPERRRRVADRQLSAMRTGVKRLKQRAGPNAVGVEPSDLVFISFQESFAIMSEGDPLDAILFGLGGSINPFSDDTNGDGIPDDCGTTDRYTTPPASRRERPDVRRLRIDSR